ncbi:MAG: hypothetical protein J2P46_15375, partial [Zavarzinella sp.]|nr:hypothetical protein [Zavarzinella sp.]
INLDAIKDKPAIPLPGKVTDACAGAGGRFVFFHCAAEKKLLVFDVSALAAVKEIPTSGPTTFVAAGATKLVLANMADRTVRRWDLVKMEQDKEAPLPFDGQLSALSLGSDSDGPALMAGTPGPSGESIRFLDVETMGPAAVGWRGLVGTVSPDVRVRAAANGSHWVALTSAGDRPRMMILTRSGNGISWGATIGLAPRYAALSADGHTLYLPSGPVETSFRLDKSVTATGPDVWLPALHGPFYLHSPQGKDSATADVLARDVPKPLGTVDALPQPEANDPLTPDQHAFFVPDAHAIVLLAPERDHLTVSPIDIPAALSKAGKPAVFITSTPPTTFTPGRPFEYTIRTYATSPNLAYTVTGPKGVTVSPDGRVRWDVPANIPDERVNLFVTASVPGATGSQAMGLYNAAAPAPKGLPPKKTDDKTKGSTPKGPTENKSPEPTVPAVAASKLVNPVAARLPITPAEMPGPHAEVAVPGPIRDLCVAGGGRYLILHCPTARKLAVFDVTTLKVAKSITLNADDVLFAAGMEKLAVVYPDEKLVIRYSLATFKPETDATLDVRQRPTAAAMGSATAGPLILGGIPAQGNASKMQLMFVDLDTLTEVPIAKAEGAFEVTFGSAAHLRASADGRTLGAWFAQLEPSGLQTARLDGNTITGSYRRASVGHVTPGPDGQTVFTAKGLFSAKAEPVARKEPAVPAVYGGAFLTVTDVPAGAPAGAKRVTVWEPGRAAPTATFDGLPGFDGKHDPFERDNPLALDKRLFLVPEAGILVVVPPAADKLHVYKLDAGKAPAKKGGG